MALPSASAFTGSSVTEAQFKTAMTDLVEYLDDLETTPVGGVVAFAMSIAPTGFLKANGAAISRTTYAALFAKIGTTFGAGDGSTTFNLPDLRGVFPRGWDDGRGLDSGRTFGAYQADAFASHQHTVTGGVSSGSASTGIINPAYGTIFGTATTAAAGGVETRPKNLALLFCIKY